MVEESKMEMMKVRKLWHLWVWEMSHETFSEYSVAFPHFSHFSLELEMPATQFKLHLMWVTVTYRCCLPETLVSSQTPLGSSLMPSHDVMCHSCLWVVSFSLVPIYYNRSDGMPLPRLDYHTLSCCFGPFLLDRSVCRKSRHECPTEKPTWWGTEDSS